MIEPQLICMVCQVYIFSYTGPAARVLEVHYDGEHIIVRKTDWIYFPNNGDYRTEEIRLFARWLMCKPIGDIRHPRTSN